MNGNHSIEPQPQPVVPPSPEEGNFPLRLGWRIICTLIFLALLVLLSLLSGYPAGAATHQQSGGTPLVLAFYYTWFDENTWQADTVPDMPVEPYASRDRAAMGRHIEQAQQTGIDALMVAWYGPSGQSNQTEPNLAAMLDEANARGFKIGILFETTSPFFAGPGDATAALRHALGVHANHPAFLRVDGKPVIFFWRPHLWSVDTWRGIRDQVDAGRNSLWIAEGTDTSYLAVFDGHHLYSNTWNPPADLNNVNQKFARLVAEARQTYGVYKYWVATVMPGYNDTRTGRANAFARDREGGAYYERSWQAALGSNPDWIIITSFNEWPEGSYIEPSVAYGDHYLNLTAHWSSQLKAGGSARAAAPPAEVQAPQSQPAAVPPAPEEPTAYVTVAGLNLRQGPSLDHLTITVMPQQTALPITGRNPEAPDWWQVLYNGQSGWAYAGYLRVAGPLEQVPEVAIPASPPPSQIETQVDEAGASIVHRILLGDMNTLIDEAHRDKLIQKWIPSTESNQ